MTGRVLLRSPPVKGKMPPLLPEATHTEPPSKQITKHQKPMKRKNNQRIGEVAGGTAAECAAVCCCCPLTVMNLLVLAIYRLPASLCRMAKKRQRLKKKKMEGLLGATDSNGGVRMSIEEVAREMREAAKEDDETENVDMEKEMWDQFFGTGFWRSPSQGGT